MKNLFPSLLTSLCLGATLSCLAASYDARLETPSFRFQLSAQNGECELFDKQTGVAWTGFSSPALLARAVISTGSGRREVEMSRCDLVKASDSILATFHPATEKPEAALRLHIRALKDKRTLEFTWDADSALQVQSVSFLGNAIAVTDAGEGAVLVPVREGLFIPANSGIAFTHRFDTYAYEGCHMAMLGLVQNGAAALLTWDDPYVAAELRSVTNAPGAQLKQQISTSLVLSKSARSFRLQFLGRGDHVTIGKAYRKVAREKGWLVPWSEKLKNHPERAKLFGAINYKLWSVLDRQMNEGSTKEESVRINWTFEEAGQVAEHLKQDLKLDKVLFTMGGWIHRGYDNQHPDILPAAPECGGDAAFVDCAQRVMKQGYLFCLHDNYQDIYRDSPSWDERFIMKTPDGKLAKGGHWAGGVAYLTCSKMALELARRPQNLEAVRKLTGANAYFIDTTYAAGLQECFDPAHPLTRADDMKWKQALSDYGREVYGIFGSECGREWAIPHSDFFEGLTGVSGGYFHDANLTVKLGASVIPLFEIVYRDAIAMYGKYEYDPQRAAGYVLHHISIGRPLNYHDIPRHLYWKNSEEVSGALALRPSVRELRQTGPQEFQVTYGWQAEKSNVKEDYRVFVHFTDAGNNIMFQDDHSPQGSLANWNGSVREGPFTVQVPDGLSGTFNVLMGLFEPSTGQRAVLRGKDNGQRNYVVGKLIVTGGKISFEPLNSGLSTGGDPGLFTRADNGWASGLHSMDRFVKNTYEILSPLNELTARVPMTGHTFLSADRSVRKTAFGEGRGAITVTVNSGESNCTVVSETGGKTVLPPNGFLIDGPTFTAFCATEWNGVHYDTPTMFTLRSLDGRPITSSRKIRVYHGFGDTSIRTGAAMRIVPREEVFVR